MNAKSSIARIATTVWVVGIILTSCLLSIPPANVPLYLGLACIAVLPLILGSGRYRVFGVLALLFLLLAALGEHRAGIAQKKQMERVRQIMATNHPSLKP